MTTGPVKWHYWRRRFTFGDEEYFVAVDWDQRNKSKFDAWAARIARLAGIAFEPYDVPDLSHDEE